MAAPLPQEEAAQFFRELQEMDASDSIRMDGIIGMRVRTTRLLNLDKINPILGYTVLAYIAYLLGDRRECMAMLEKAFSFGTAGNFWYLCALKYHRHMGMPREGMKLAREVLRLFPDDLDALYQAAIFSTAFAEINLSKAFMAQIDKLSVNGKLDRIKSLQKVSELTSSRIARLRVSEDYVIVRLESAIGAVRNAGYEIRRLDQLTLNDGTFITRLYVDATIEQCSFLNFTIAEKLISEFEDSGIDLFSVTCLPLDYFETEAPN
ncbi:tetratricopeptide repeat protein [Herbaspirillum frisingense]|uniref:tetratricopeptide repeat protein n=1 Tax=Herbaspirillum frisingense TaxID=92645 RepID=UPI0039AF9930